MKAEQGFQPTPFTETHAFFTDPVLPNLLKRLLPNDVYQYVEDDLARLGTEVLPAMQSAAGRLQLPKVVQYDQWGQRIDDLQTSEGWRELKAIHQKEGIPGIFYERKFGGLSRIYGFAKVHLMMGHSHMLFCPLSMTDGNARTIELLGTPAMKKQVLPRLISRDPSVAYTAGQWMTERPGGSDVSLTETVAHPTGKTEELGVLYRLDGFKWFSSATDSNLALALARTGSIKDGSRGLSLFLIPMQRPFNPKDLSSNRPAALTNGVFIHRLKNKIGTHEVPTAELSIEGADGYLVGELGKGVKGIASVLNITRVYSSLGSAGALRRCLTIATSYSQVRSIRMGSQLLSNNDLHVALLAEISVVYHALVHLSFGAIHLLGKVECNEASVEEQDRLRILTPVVKAFASEKASIAMEQAMSSLGGAGYMEENEIGRLIRDALVEKIWEGTTSVLALDLRRATQDKSSLNSFITWCERVITTVPPQLKATLEEPLKVLATGLKRLSVLYSNKDTPATLYKPSLMLFGYVASTVYLLEQTIWSYANQRPEREKDIEIVKRWVLENGFVESLRLIDITEKDVAQRVVLNEQLVFGASQLAKSKL